MKTRLHSTSTAELEANDLRPSVPTTGQPAAAVVQRCESTLEEIAELVKDDKVEQHASLPQSSSPRSRSRPNPVPSQRPEGRRVFAGILLAMGIALSVGVWNSFLRFQAYGLVEGQLTPINAPWPGILDTVCVKAGEHVRRGDLLAVIWDPELDARIDRTSDAIKSAQADLTAEMARLNLAALEQRRSLNESRQRYYQLRANLAEKETDRADIDAKLSRRQELVARNAVSLEEMDSLRFKAQGLALQVQELREAVAHLEQFHSDEEHLTDHASELLEPYFAKITEIQTELRRLRDLQQRGLLRAPSSGEVVKLNFNSGTNLQANETLLEFLPEGNQELVIYVEQSNAKDYSVGEVLPLVISPSQKTVTCTVARIGSRLEEPPRGIQGRFAADRKYLPIYLLPPDEVPADVELRLGSTVSIPRFWSL